MQGPSSKRARLRLLTVFAAAFIAGAAAIFEVMSLAGAWIARSGLSSEWRMGIAAAALIGLAVLDVWTVRRADYCPIGLRRQTPQSLLFRLGTLRGAAVWAFDTGLAVTTFRVAAITWAALMLTALGFGSWRTGIVYGVAFVVPLLVMMTRPIDARRLGALLKRRTRVQIASALALSIAGTALLFQFSI